MLATVAFLAFWVVVGLVLFFIARARRTARRARDAAVAEPRRPAHRDDRFHASSTSPSASPCRPLILVGNHDSADARVGGMTIELTQQEEDGREIFGERCASCHTLAAASADGKVGPNLDQQCPPEGLVPTRSREAASAAAARCPPASCRARTRTPSSAFVAAVAGR